MRFPALEACAPWLRHTFVLRHPALAVNTDRATALARLQQYHREAVKNLGFAENALRLAEQVHGACVACAEEAAPAIPAPGADGLATNRPGLALGIYVADCAAVYVVDPVRRVIALLHSGRRGSEEGIIKNALRLLHERYGSEPRDLLVQLSPCIRPPDYEVDFAAWIRRDAAACGVPASQIFDEGHSTASDLRRYYSYRLEKGRTGRLFAVLGLAGEPPAEGHEKAD